jgi:hypothetical protein
MQNFLRSFKKLSLKVRAERRKHPRYSVFIKTHFMIRGYWYKGYIKNISEGGAYILSIPGLKVSTGEYLLLVVQLKTLLDQIKGKIIWRESDSIALAFNTSALDYSRLKALFASRGFF